MHNSGGFHNKCEPGESFSGNHNAIFYSSCTFDSLSLKLTSIYSGLVQLSINILTEPSLYFGVTDVHVVCLGMGSGALKAHILYPPLGQWPVTLLSPHMPTTS